MVRLGSHSTIWLTADLNLTNWLLSITMSTDELGTTNMRRTVMAITRGGYDDAMKWSNIALSTRTHNNNAYAITLI